ncbi:hypothetical protein E0H46_31855 [Rhizobium leguminosarum bv. viciae]|nr:hypothetical protein E0H46_31855 [Rhizobium leguminosarum bv. viciae]
MTSDGDMQRMIDDGNIRHLADAAAIKRFEHDLKAMSEAQLRQELDEVSERIDDDTAWQEAIMAMLRRIESQAA